MSEEEKEKIEQEFQYALDEILSLVKGETAIAIVHKEQSMILLFEKLLLKIDKLQKENEFLKAPFEYANGNTLDKRCVELNFISKDKIENKIKELEKSENAGISDIYEIKKEFAIEILKELL